MVDALPYYDQGYDETGVRDAAIALVEEETRRYRPTKNYLDYLPAPQHHAFETEILKNEMERVQVGYNLFTRSSCVFSWCYN